MKLMETDDPIKGQLLKKSAMHREQLEEEVKLISDRTQKMLTNAVVIGGALALTYIVVSRFSRSSSKKKSKAAKIKLIHSDRDHEAPATVAAEPEAPGFISQIGAALASQASVFLLQLAKEKLEEFMEAQAARKTQSNDPA
jgi:hypothetical protein